MSIQTCAFPNYYAIILAVGQYVSACAQFEIFVIKVGSTWENKTDINKKQIFRRKRCLRPTEIFLFSKYPCTTVTVKLELNVSAYAQ